MTSEVERAIMSFIKDCWSENHIMARDRALFEYEFAYDNEVNMVIALWEQLW